MTRARQAIPQEESEALVEKADAVIEGILDGSLSRPKVQRIGRAVAERTEGDAQVDAIHRAIR